MKAHKSALEHGIDEADSIHAAQYYVYAADLDDDHPARQFRLGFDLKAPPGTGRSALRQRYELLIRAMKARPQYFDLLP